MNDVSQVVLVYPLPRKSFDRSNQLVAKALWVCLTERILFLINCELRYVYSTSLKPMHACALFSHHCLVCSAIRKGGRGLFCGNYLLAWGNYPPCGSVWCSECYRESQNDNFPRLDHLQSGSDLEVDAANTQGRYQCGRNVDSFRNVVGGDPDVLDARDKFTLFFNQTSAHGCDVGKAAQHSGCKLVPVKEGL
jgi:hypothetical protein